MDVYDKNKEIVRDLYSKLLRENYAKDLKIERLREALHRISLGSQNSSTTKEDLGKEARAALNSN